MWGLLIRAVGFLGTIGTGWMVSDYFNEKKTTEQLEAQGNPNAQPTWVLVVKVVAVIFVVASAIFWIWKYLKNRKENGGQK